MFDKAVEEKWPKTIKAIIIWCTLILFFLSMFFPSTYMYNNMIREINYGKEFTGSDFPNIMERTNKNYEWFFIKTGIDDGLKEFYQINSDPILKSNEGPGGMFIRFFRNMAEDLNYYFYIIVYRVSMALYLVPHMLTMLVISFAGGVMRWKSKRYTFGYVSPWLNRRSYSLIGWGVYSIALSLFIPFTLLPVIGGVIMLLMIPLFCLLFVSNMPKRI